MTDSTICSKEGCTNKIYSKKTGLCRGHAITRKICVTEGCTKLAHCADQLCDEHAGKQKPICETEGCSNIVINGKQFCGCHGGKKKCITEGCNNLVHIGDYCSRHSIVDKEVIGKCSKDGCSNQIYCKKTGLCRGHATTGKICVTEGCTKLAHCAGQLCDEHAGKQKPICETEGCQNGAISGKKFCSRHGGRKLCITTGCKKQARAGGHCVSHGSNDVQKCKLCKVVSVTKKRYVEEEDTYVWLCAQCFANTYPNERRPLLLRRKQLYLKKYLEKDFGTTYFRHDKRIPDGESFKRPDFLHIFDKYGLIIECDEDRHEDNKEVVEIERLELIQKDLKNLPIICIRWNPDKYKTSEGCFKIDEDDKLMVDDDEFNLRYTKLKESINKYTNDTQVEGIQIEELFY